MSGRLLAAKVFVSSERGGARSKDEEGERNGQHLLARFDLAGEVLSTGRPGRKRYRRATAYRSANLS